MRLLKYFIIVIVVSVSLTGLATLMVNKGLRRSTVDFYGKMNVARDSAFKSDMLIIGSSRAFAHIDPQILLKGTGLTSYNYGLNAAGFNTCYNMVKYALTFQKEVKVIVLNFDYFMFDDSQDPYKKEYYYPFEKDINGKFKLSGSPQFIHKLKLLDISFYDDYALYASLAGWLRPEKVVTTANNGYLPGAYEMNFKPPSQQVLQLKKTPFTEKGIKVLEDIILECYANNIKLCIVEAPYIDKYNPDTYITNYNYIKSRVHAISKRYAIPFFDFSKNEQITTDSTLFYNANHMNTKGSSLYSNMLADSIRQYIKQ